jgi:hypothetical protein
MNPQPQMRPGPDDKKATAEAWEAIDDFFARHLPRRAGS